MAFIEIWDLGFDNSEIPLQLSTTKFDTIIDVWQKNKEEIEKDAKLISALFEAQIHIQKQLFLT